MARRRRRIAPEVYQEIHRMVREGVYTSAARVHRALEERFGAETPSVRTVQDIVRELDPPDPSGPWTPGPENDPEDDARILSTLAELFADPDDLEKWGGKTSEVTRRLLEQAKKTKWQLPSREHARWIAWIRAGWPDLGALGVWTLAGEYRARRALNQDTSDCDAFLAFAPWRSFNAHTRYTALVENGQVPPPKSRYFGLVADLQLILDEWVRTQGTRSDKELERYATDLFNRVADQEVRSDAKSEKRTR